MKGAVAEAGGGATFVAREGGSRTASRRQPVTGPTCPGCATSLDEAAVYRILDVPEHEGDGKATVLFLYCQACGLAIDDVVLPEGE